MTPLLEVQFPSSPRVFHALTFVEAVFESELPTAPVLDEEGHADA